MMWAENMFGHLAEYNRWMNENLCTVCSGMKDEERKRDMGSFFRSIHATFNHILLVDRLWLARIRKEPITVSSLDQELYADFSELTRERTKTDKDIALLVKSLDTKNLIEPVVYTSIVSKTEVVLPLGSILIHLFHHQTHHRGQITAMISQLGYDYGKTDIIAWAQEQRPPLTQKLS
jgi:uncharacterized damage-inducible protein DinB